MTEEKKHGGKCRDFLRTKPHHNMSMIEGRIPPTHIGVVVEHRRCKWRSEDPQLGQRGEGSHRASSGVKCI